LSKIEVNEIDKQNGSTLTIGGSGTTVQLGTGATQTGFGREGSVNWQTTKKTTAFTAANGEGYFVDTAASGAVTMTLPASPSAGNIVAVKDYNGNFAAANLTIGRNGSPINGGSAADITISTAGASIVLVYVDATQGWVATQDDSSTFSGVTFIEATGGNTVATCGDCKIHTFTSPGTFSVSAISSTASENDVSYMVVAGGGGGGFRYGGGGGAGGFREAKNPATPYTASPLDGYPSAPNRVTVTAASFPITVGGGGTGGVHPSTNSSPGSNSIFSTVTSAGGGGGGGSGQTPSPAGYAGGSGGGGSATACGGAGNTPPSSPAQGTAGGGSAGAPRYGSGGGGGAGAAGADGQTLSGGNGGNGVATSITGSSVTRGGGGGGGLYYGGSPTGSGGTGGGGPSSPAPTAPASGGTTGTAGTANTGGGGGGGSDGTGTPYGVGGAGGSGIVVIRYKFQ